MEFDFLQLVNGLGPGGAVLVFFGWKFLQERRNGKASKNGDVNTPILKDIHKELQEMNGSLSATQKRVEDIWDRG